MEDLVGLFALRPPADLDLETVALHVDAGGEHADGRRHLPARRALTLAEFLDVRVHLVFVTDEIANALASDWSEPVQLRLLRLPGGRIELQCRRPESPEPWPWEGV